MKFILPTLFIIASILIFFTVTSPLYSDMSDKTAQIAKYDEALNRSKELQQTRDQLLAKYNSIKQEDKDKLDHFLPNTVNNIKFILEVEQLANIHGMPIKNIKFEPPVATDPKDSKGTVVVAATPENSKPYGTFPIEFTVDGNYDSFVLFMKDLEHNLRLVDVKSVSFTVPANTKGQQGAQDPNVYSYNIKVNTYWLK